MLNFFKYLFSLVSILLIVQNCNSKKKSQESGFHCGSWVLPEKDWIKSEVNTIETLKNKDSNTSFLQGKVFGISKTNDSIIYEPLVFTSIAVKYSNDSSYTMGDVSDLNGEFNIQLNPDSCEVKFSFIGYNSIVIDKLTLQQGEIIKIEVNLGQGGGTNYYRKNRFH
ncbi:MAG: hypothetical protein ACPGVD_02890 [Flavobacteriales bacterium]